MKWWKGAAVAVVSALACAARAADRPLVIENGQTMELPTGAALQTRAPTAANASINLPHGTAPSAPADGDCWTTTLGLFCRINGTTTGPYGAGVAAFTAPAHQWINAISGLGVASASRPACADISDAGAFCSGASAASLTGALSCGQLPALSGDVTTSGCAATIAANAVTTSKINPGAVTEAKQTLSDVTTANVSTSAHGYAPKAPNDATKYLDGTGAWSTPSPSGITAAYSTGSWTPSLTFGGGSTGLTYTTDTGTYVQVGKLVCASMSLQISTKGSSTGSAAIGGLPFPAVSAPSTQYQGSGLAYESGLPGQWWACLGACGGVNSTSFVVGKPTGGIYQASDFINGTQLIVDFCYTSA